MADALALKSDEGRSIAAISVGEVQSNLWSDDFRMGKPYQVNPDNFRCNSSDVRTLGSKTFQYQVEKRTIVIPLVAASETGRAQTYVAIRGGCKVATEHFIMFGKLQMLVITEASGKKHPSG